MLDAIWTVLVSICGGLWVLLIVAWIIDIEMNARKHEKEN